MLRASLLLIAASTLGSAACHLASCTLIAHNAVEIEVRDSITGEPAADSATGRITRGTQAFDLQLTGWTAEHVGLWLTSRGSGPGTYQVEVSKPGYRTWQQSGVVVTEGDCGMNTVRLQARLQR